MNPNMSKLLRYQVLLHRVTEQAHTLDDLLEGRTTVDVEGDDTTPHLLVAACGVLAKPQAKMSGQPEAAAREVHFHGTNCW